MLFSFFAQWFTDGFLRTDMLDRNRNTSNHEIDLCQIYGLKECKTDILRDKNGGKLKFQLIDGEMYPRYLFDVDATSNENWVFAENFEDLHDISALRAIYQGTPEEQLKKMFAVGVEHGNSTIGHTIFNTIMLREHNRICDCLAAEYKNWDDERLFQTTRNILNVILLRIVIRDYIKHISPITFAADIIPGDAEKRPWYRTNRMSIEFNLLYRWHSMVPEQFNVEADSYTLSDLRNNVPLVLEHGLGKLVNAASVQRAGKIGLGNTHHFFFVPLPFYDGGKSVMEVTVQMARDAKLQSYNEYRKAFGLRALRNFEELTDDPAFQQKLSTMYQGRIESVEWLVGIFAQKHGEGAMLGDLMTRMVGYDAFTQALTNPLLSKYLYNEATFTKHGLREIEATDSLHDIFERNLSSFSGVHVSFKT